MGYIVTGEYVTTNVGVLVAARAAFANVAIEDAVDGGCCNNCGVEGVVVFLTDIAWLCYTCLWAYDVSSSE